MSSKSANDNNDEEKQTTLQDDFGSLDTTSLDSQPLGDKAGDDNAFVPGSVKKASHRASERVRFYYDPFLFVLAPYLPASCSRDEESACLRA